MRKVLFALCTFSVAMLLTFGIFAAETVIYANDFSDAATIADFKQYRSAWEIRDGALYMTSVKTADDAEKDDHFSHIVYQSQSVLTDYILEVDMHGASTWAGPIFNVQQSNVNNNNAGFFGYSLTMSKEASFCALGCADAYGDWRGNIHLGKESDDVYAGASLHFAIIVKDGKVGLAVYNNDTGKTVYTHTYGIGSHDNDAVFVEGTVGFRALSELGEAVNADTLHFDNLVITTATETTVQEFVDEINQPTPIDTSGIIPIYENTFDDPVDIALFKQLYGTWEVIGGKLWLTDVENVSNALFIYNGRKELKELTDYVVDVDMYNVQTQAGLIIRSDVSRIVGNMSGDDFYGYLGYVSYDGTKGALGRGDTGGDWGGMFSASDSIFLPGADIHLQIAVKGNVISYYVTDIESGKALYSTTVRNSQWEAGSFGLRMNTKIRDDGLDNVSRTAFDNLTVSTFASELKLIADSKTSYVDGIETEQFVAPFVEDGELMTIMLPFTECFGITTAWTEATQTVTVKIGIKKIDITLGSTTAYIDGVAVEMPVAAYTAENKHTYYPARFLAKAIGADVLWDEETGTMTINPKSTDEEKDSVQYYMASELSYYEFEALDEDEYTFTFGKLLNLNNFTLSGEFVISASGMDEFDKVVYTLKSGGVISVKGDTVKATDLSPAEALCSILGEDYFVATVDDFTDENTITVKDGDTVVVSKEDTPFIKATVYTAYLTDICDSSELNTADMYVPKYVASEGEYCGYITVGGIPRYRYPLALGSFANVIIKPTEGVLTDLDYLVSDSGFFIQSADESGKYSDAFTVDIDTVAKYDAVYKMLDLIVIKSLESHVHLAGDWVVTVEPTMTSTGTKVKYCVFCGEALKQSSVPCLDHGILENYEYVVENGSAVITKYKGTEATVTVPQNIDGYPVTKIKDKAFYSNSKIKKLIVPAGILEIGTSAFEDCTSLVDIELPEGLLTIGDHAFQDTFCSGTGGYTLDLPESITHIGKLAFSGCSKLQYIDMPDSLKTMGATVFMGCNYLDEIILPEGLAAIGSGTFYTSRMGLKRLYIPRSVKEIGVNAFWKGVDLGVVLYDVYYGGSPEEFLKIEFSEGNTTLINADIVFNASAYSFNTNGGSAISPIIGTEGIKTAPVTEKSGYYFGGWYESPDFSGDKVSFPYEKEGTVTLYAKWVEKTDLDYSGVTALADVLVLAKAVLSGSTDSIFDFSGDGRVSLIDVIVLLKEM